MSSNEKKVWGLFRRSDSQKADLLEAAKRYHAAYRGSPAESYLHHRGLGEAAGRFKIGYVSDPIPGHDQYRGRLVIPYLRPREDSIT
ncbi:hypothetical protein ACFQ2B_26225 [Streptomyces stramineus]